MAYMNEVQRIDECRVQLRAVGDMKVPVTAFLDDELYALAAGDEPLWRQAAFMASIDSVQAAHLMPDTHPGYGVPIGAVIVTRDTLALGGAGFDIGCGMVAMRLLGVTAEDLVDPAVRRTWIDEVIKRIPLGIGRHRAELMESFSSRTVEDVLRNGPGAIGVDTSFCERARFEVSSVYDPARIPNVFDKAVAQLGSLGGGNHFVELLCDEDDGQAYAIVHSGSRGYGHDTADWFFRYDGDETRGKRDETLTSAGSAFGREYMDHHNAAANYASANRWVMYRAIAAASCQTFSDCSPEPIYEISHNLVQKEQVSFDGESWDDAWVHRKGATRAFPSRHPMLAGTRWFNDGHPIIVPGSMYEGAALLRAMPPRLMQPELTRAYDPAEASEELKDFMWTNSARSCFSVNHGAGRVMGRMQAKKKRPELGGLKGRGREIDREMRIITRTLGGVEVVGVLSNHRQIPLDECRHVYKQLDPVLNTLVRAGICEVEHRLWPVANVKG